MKGALELGGISSLLWTSLTPRVGHRKVPGGRPGLGDAHPTQLGLLVGSSGAAVASLLPAPHARDKQALCSHAADTGLRVPTRREGKVETNGAEQKKAPEAAHCHPGLSQM